MKTEKWPIRSKGAEVLASLAEELCIRQYRPRASRVRNSPPKSVACKGNRERPARGTRLSQEERNPTTQPDS
jgi:hypothetical protein